jgi:ubiquinone/menaquinone biosynthesis C-methylase UbiE
MTNVGETVSVDERNKQFWNELCGTQLAKQLGVHDSSPESLMRFDDWYFDFYPYLYKHIPFADMNGKKVLDIGLGYGTVAQKLAECGAVYQGLDIAEAPVAMATHRLAQLNLPGKALQGSVLDAPFPKESFDWVIAIGCFHHTGNVKRALDETWRVLKPGGQAMVMVYSAYSYRRWLYAFSATVHYLIWDKLRIGKTPQSSERERKHYDASGDGVGAPETAFVSVSHMRRMTKQWRSARVTSENIGTEGPFLKMERDRAIQTYGPWCGLDLYCRLLK